jgi:hypothetical protein
MPLIVSLTEKNPQWKLLIICVGIILLFICQYGIKFLVSVYQHYDRKKKIIKCIQKGGKLYTDKNGEFIGAFPMDDPKFIAWIKCAMKILPEYKDMIKSWIKYYENQIGSSQDRAIAQSHDATGWVIDKTLGIFIETLVNEYDDYSQQLTMEDIRKRWPVDAIRLPLRQSPANISEGGPGPI